MFDWRLRRKLRASGKKKKQNPEMAGADNIETWLGTGNFTCPVTNQVLRSFDQILNHTLRKMIQDWKWGFESERNKLCIVANGVTFNLASFITLHGLVHEAHQDVPVKQNAISVLKEIKSFDQQEIEVRIDSRVDETLVKFLKEPISRTITKASLMVIFAMVSSPNENIKASFVEKGLVSLLLNLIVDSEKSICEKGLGVLDKLFKSKEGREEAYQNALAMPVLVKKILRVSELATEFSVSAIWKLSKFDKKNEGKILFEALQVGVFQKLVLLLLCGYDDSTKEKTIQLLKLMNHRMH
ncbi:hypothetical protein Pint_16865 [Pistacia integerrima]|uniref:Uncharacterized protein n=1 Tax=Pistacia integerrima TaxID=434235 RepID=A0ACC0ZF17_9ROSI|nr:hypothetical protein Pint_16865 [Pistacia integerrima]